MSTRSLVLLCIGFSFLISCSKSKSNKEKFAAEQMEFNVDSTLLGTEIIDNTLKIKYKHPVGWLKLEDSIHAAIAKEVGAITEKYTMNIHKVMMDTITSSVFMLSSFKHISDTYLDTLLFNRDTTLHITNTVVSHNNFIFNSFFAAQYIYQNTEKTRFRLIVYNQPLNFQLDYIIPNHYYAKNIKSIESSIGSFKRITNYYKN